MRCEPRTYYISSAFTYYFQIFLSVLLLTSFNLIHHFNIFPSVYLILTNLIVNNFITLVCFKKEVPLYLDIPWKLFSTIIFIDSICFHIKIGLDVIMVVKEIFDHLQAIGVRTRSYTKEKEEDKKELSSDSIIVQRRQSIHRRNGNIDNDNNDRDQVEETFLIKKIFTLNIGKTNKRNNSKASKNSFSIDLDNSTNDSFFSSLWGSNDKPSSSSNNCDNMSTPSSSSSSNIVKPSRLSFSPSNNNSNEQTKFQFSSSLPVTATGSSLAEHNIRNRSAGTTLSQMVYYSSAPKVIYVEIPDRMVEQTYLKFICYFLTLIIIYIVYNEYRVYRMLSSSHAPIEFSKGTV